jgi:hypothetical protein
MLPSRCSPTDVGVSDCEYRPVRVIQARGTDQAKQWLRERAAQHDQLVLESTFQAGLVREPAAWIARSALGGIVVLPTALAAMYGSTAPPCADQPTTLITAAAFASGVIYAWLTLDGATNAVD